MPGMISSTKPRPTRRPPARPARKKRKKIVEALEKISELELLPAQSLKAAIAYPA